MADAITQTKRKLKIKRKTFIILMLALPIAHLLLFWFYVNLQTFVYAFRVATFETGELSYKFSLFQFERIIKEIFSGSNLILKTFSNSIIYFIFTSIMIQFLTILFSYFIYKKIGGYKVFRVVFFLPSIISMVVLSMVFRYSVDPINGFVNRILSFLMNVPMSSLPNWLYGETQIRIITVIVYCLWTGFGVGTVLYSGAMSRIPESVIEYGRLEGITIGTELFKVVLPMIWSSFSTYMLLNLSSMFMFIGPLLIFYPTKTSIPNSASLSYYIIYYLKDGSNLYEYPAAIGLVITFISLPIIFGARAILKKMDPNVEY